MRLMHEFTASHPEADLAPIALFVYNRPDHTRRTLQALAANGLADRSDLIIFSDGPRDPADAAAVSAVRDAIKSTGGFRKVEIRESISNRGLARSIIDGVAQVLESHGKIIVLEDDLVTSPAFLMFMNSALSRYQLNRGVWHVSGWGYPISPEGLPETYFSPIMNCWGWATWKDRWSYFVKDPNDLIRRYGNDKAWIRKFNLDGAHDFWSQIKGNASGEFSTWAIFWFATIFLQGGLCLNPTQTYVQNTGIDGSGTHCGEQDVYRAELSMNMILNWPPESIANELIIERIRLFYRRTNPTLIERVLRRTKALLRL